jgi:hypothetical protein
MKGQMLELQRPDAAPQLVPAVDLQAASKALFQSQLRMLAYGSDSSRNNAASSNNTPSNAGPDSANFANDSKDSRAIVGETKAVQAVNVASRVELPPAQAKELSQAYSWQRCAKETFEFISTVAASRRA